MANQVAQPQFTNDALRTLMLGTAIRKCQTMPVQNYATTGQMTFILPNVGLGMFARVYFTGQVNPTTNNATAGTRFPFSLLSNVSLIDPQGVNRVYAKPWHLYRMGLEKRYSWFFDTYQSKIANTAEANASALVYTAAGTVYTAGANANVRGFFDVPMAISPTDLRGSFRLDVPNGQTQLIVTPATTLVSSGGGCDVPFTQSAGGVVTTGLQIKVDYYYLDPVAVAVSNNQSIVPWPLGDMAYIHELLSIYNTGLSAGSEYLWTLGTGREYLRIMHFLNNNGTAADFSAADFTQRRFLINANIPTLTEDMQEYLSSYFEHHGFLPTEEQITFNFHNRPWDSDRYGNLQTGLTLASGSTVNGTSTLETLRQTIYQTVSIPG